MYKWAWLVGGWGQLALGTNEWCDRSYCSGVQWLCRSGSISRGSQSAQGTNDICHRSYCPGVVGLCTSGLG